MPSRSLTRSFLALWWTLGVTVLILSVRTVLHAVAAGRPLEIHPVLIGSIEAAAALAFLLPRTLRVGAIGLLLTFAIAYAVHAAEQPFRGDLFVYAAAVLFVAVHGPVPIGPHRAPAAAAPETTARR